MKKLLTIAALCLLAANAQAGEWHVDKKAKDNLITFTSEVVALTFDGTTDQVDGYIYWEGENLFEKKSQFFFEVELASFDTGIGNATVTCATCSAQKNGPKPFLKAGSPSTTPILPPIPTRLKPRAASPCTASNKKSKYLSRSPLQTAIRS